MSNNKLNKPNLGAHLQGPGSAAWKQSWWTLRWMWIYVNTRVTAVGGLSLLVNSQSFRVGGGIKPSDQSNFLLSDLPTDRHCDAASFVLLVVVSFPITLTLRCGIVCNCCWCMCYQFSVEVLIFNEIVFVECFVWKVCGELNVCWNAWTAGNDNARNARANAPRIVTVFHSVTVWQGLVYFLVIIEALVTLLPCLPPRRPLHCLALTAPPMCNVKHHLDIFHNNARWSLPKIPRRRPWQFNFSTISRKPDRPNLSDHDGFTQSQYFPEIDWWLTRW